MISKINTCVCVGIEGHMVVCECDLSSGLPAFDVVGLPDTSVREARDRVRAAIKNCGFDFPLRRITVNLAPAQLKKSGTLFDLPIFLGILLSSDQINHNFTDYAFIGELSLDGHLRPISGALPMTLAALDHGIKGVFVPQANAAECAAVRGIDIYPVSKAADIIAHFDNEQPIKPMPYTEFQPKFDASLDYSDVLGQEDGKIALMTAAAGGHNLAMVGPPGSGKSMLARRLPGILPRLTYKEALEVTKIYSVLGKLSSDEALIATRPFRSPHHTLSPSALVGGSSNPRPGEISMAHNGVLFMDELPEFHSDVLEVLRQPMEDGVVTVSRASGSATYPCRFMLVAAMNPCKCGYYGFDELKCRCSDLAVKKYMQKLSGPLMDRIDLHISVQAVDYKTLEGRKQGLTSKEMAEQVENARLFQLERYKDLDINCNAQLTPSLTARFCTPDAQGAKLLERAFSRLGLSARGYDKILKVARTIADMEQNPTVSSTHVAQAISYRDLDRQ